MVNPEIGVVAFQGDFQRHLEVFKQLGATARPVRRPEELVGLSGLAIPGGESTTIGMLIERFGLLDPIRDLGRRGVPLFGTCAGAILLARRIEESDQVRLGLMDLTVERNAYGRQIDSFEAEIPVSILGEDPVTGVFIRAPRIVSVEPTVEVLARFEDAPVLVRQGAMIALTFHPELTGDNRIHRFFLEQVEDARR